MTTPAARRLKAHMHQTEARLQEITTQARYSIRACARDLGISHVYLRTLLRGEGTPTWELAAQIERRTRGQIRAAELVPHEGSDGGDR